MNVFKKQDFYWNVDNNQKLIILLNVYKMSRTWYQYICDDFKD
jgi:hypothetical protein